jgi:hypothetical protein
MGGTAETVEVASNTDSVNYLSSSGPASGWYSVPQARLAKKTRQRDEGSSYTESPEEDHLIRSLIYPLSRIPILTSNSLDRERRRRREVQK